MYRYKLIAKRLIGIKSPLEKNISKNLEQLTNDGMIDVMYHQYKRYEQVTHFTMPSTIHRSWLQR